ncbi:hypothetical protein ACFP3Q_04575 [Nocardioides sp. GCM10027113]|uniref:hypothetical protein n=1 Tax=unclassified Nocardioides TaxID=2615069 RepID=UPI00360D1587
MAGLSLSLALVAGLVVWRVVDDPYVATPPETAPAGAPAGEASAVLQSLEEAVRTGDTRAAADLAPAGDRRARRLLTGLVTTAREAGVEGFSLRYVDELGGVDAEGAWSAAVATTWAFAGFDARPARTEVSFRFTGDTGDTDGAGDTTDTVAISGIGGSRAGEGRSPVWMSPGVEVRRSADHLLLVDGGRAQADRLDRRVRTAVPAVRAVLGEWEGGLVVEVPSSSGALHRSLAADPGTYDRIAAVTTSVDGSLTGDAPVHVFVNPEVYGRLQPRGAQVVMSHEAVHVATDAALSTMPLWLLEGFADYVALRDVRLPLSVTAGQVIRQVRRDGPPEALPGQTEFDTAETHLGASYEAAWLACRLLADLGGEAELVGLYRDVQSGDPVEEALRARFGLGEAELTRRWRAFLTDLSG